MKQTSFLLLIFISLILPFHLNAQQNKLGKQEQTFEEFWSFFNAHYAFFEDKNIDWQNTYDEYRTKISNQTSDDELYDILCKMVKPFNDSHVNIKRPGHKIFSASRESRVRKEFKGYNIFDYYVMIENTLYKEGFAKMQELGAKTEGIPLYNFTNNKKYGYLRINRCAPSKLIVNGKLKALDKIIDQFKDKDAVIIDMRFNPGGTDKFSFDVAGRFTEKEFLGHYKQERIKDDGFTELEPHFVKPAGKTKFLKPVIILTNDVTVSAADVFVLIMKELPQVTIIGENSNGSFSDLYPGIFPEKLHNGWKVNLSNQRYLSADKIIYEGKGVPVDIEVLNMQSDIETKHDSVLKKAISVLEDIK